MKITFMPYPDVDDRNKYISIMVNILSSMVGVSVTPFDTRRFFFLSKDIWTSEIVWLNWYENIQGLHKVALRILMLIILKIAKKKIVYTLHNKRPHDKELTKYSNLFLKSIFFLSDTIIIHCRTSKTEIPNRYHWKICYLPHPNYINEYGDILEEKPTDKLRLLFLGQIKPYKNVEILINSTIKLQPDSYELSIVGRVHSQEYASELKRLAEGRNILFEFDFIKDEDINKYLSNCDILVLPYDLKSSLNSGTVILAFSYQKTVICPRIGTIQDMKSKKFLVYDYENCRDHETALINTIEGAINLKTKNRTIFEEWGKEMYNEVESKNSKTKIKQIIKEQILSQYAR